jgi:hypothetical protein
MKKGSERTQRSGWTRRFASNRISDSVDLRRLASALGKLADNLEPLNRTDEAA